MITHFYSKCGTEIDNETTSIENSEEYQSIFEKKDFSELLPSQDPIAKLNSKYLF